MKSGFFQDFAVDKLELNWLQRAQKKPSLVLYSQMKACRGFFLCGNLIQEKISGGVIKIPRCHLRETAVGEPDVSIFLCECMRGLVQIPKPRCAQLVQ